MVFIHHEWLLLLGLFLSYQCGLRAISSFASLLGFAVFNAVTVVLDRLIVRHDTAVDCVWLHPSEEGEFPKVVPVHTEGCRCCWYICSLLQRSLLWQVLILGGAPDCCKDWARGGKMSQSSGFSLVLSVTLLRCALLYLQLGIINKNTKIIMNN